MEKASFFELAMLAVSIGIIMLVTIIGFLAVINKLFKPKNEKYWHVSDKPKDQENEKLDRNI